MTSRFRSGSVALMTVAALTLASTSALAKNPPYDPLTLTCVGGTQSALIVDVKAGATGAPAGFTLQWMSLADYEALGGWDDSKLCKQSFSGQPSFTGNTTSRWELGPNDDIEIHVGDFLYDETGASGDLSSPLNAACIPACGTEYVFRAFAHASRFNSRSEFSTLSGNGSPNLSSPGETCATDACNGGCTLTQGYWKSHGPGSCHSGNNANAWPGGGLTLGTVVYTDAQICSILNAPAKGNGLIALAHQLIAAKFNVAVGGVTCGGSDIAAADALIGNKVVPPVGTGSIDPSVTSPLVGTLTTFNEGDGCADHCPGRPALKPANSNKMKWGTLKSHYK